jgi:hypothetical protein
MYAIPLIAKSAMNGAQFRAQRVGNAGGGLIRNKNASSIKYEIFIEFYGLPPIGQKQRRPMDGAQFHLLRVGCAGAGLLQSLEILRQRGVLPQPGKLCRFNTRGSLGGPMSVSR